jgi:hypothetical protein
MTALMGCDECMQCPTYAGCPDDCTKLKYQRKPEYVHAKRWYPNHPAEGVEFPMPEWFQKILPDRVRADIVKERGLFSVGSMRHQVSPGDYIVTNEKGVKSLMKPAEFEAIYEAVEQEPDWTAGDASSMHS